MVAPRGLTKQPRLASLFLVCSDLLKSADFYQQLGFLIQEKKSRSLILSLGDGLQLHLHEPLSPDEEDTFGLTTGRGSTCLVQSYEVENLEDLAGRADSDSVLYGPSTTKWGQRLMMVIDPDGHRLEFRQRPPGSAT